jgi:uncharacterized protein YacL
MKKTNLVNVVGIIIGLIIASIILVIFFDKKVTFKDPVISEVIYIPSNADVRIDYSEFLIY